MEAEGALRCQQNSSGQNLATGTSIQPVGKSWLQAPFGITWLNFAS
jgi:hypothetical protein